MKQKTDSKPILFNTLMVKSILDGQKTVTRRPAKSKQPYQVGDIMYVRETWGCYSDDWTSASFFEYKARYSEKEIEDGFVIDEAGNKYCLPKWRPSIHMPKEAARIYLRVKNVKYYKHFMKAMCNNDAIKEGFDDLDSFRKTWNDIYGSETMPVWMIEFEFLADITDWSVL